MFHRFPLGTSAALLSQMRLGGDDGLSLPGFTGGVTHVDFEVPSWAQFDGPPVDI